MLFTYVSVPVWEIPVTHYKLEVVNTEEQLKKEQMRMNIFNKGGMFYMLHQTWDSIPLKYQGKFKDDSVDSIHHVYRRKALDGHIADY